jgi:hypothetical protein
MSYSRRGFREKKCYLCGANMIIADQWAYKMHIPHRVYFCRYSCLTKFRNQRKEGKNEQRKSRIDNK